MSIQNSVQAAQVLMDCSYVIAGIFLSLSLVVSLIEESAVHVIGGGLSGFVIQLFLTNNPNSSAAELISFAEGTLVFTASFTAFMAVLVGICLLKKFSLVISLILGIVAFNAVPSAILAHVTGSFFSSEVRQEVTTREIPVMANTPKETESPDMMKVSFIEASAEALEKERTAKVEEDAIMEKERQLAEKKRLNAIKAAKKTAEPKVINGGRSKPEATAVVIVPDAQPKRKVYNLYEEISAN